MYEIMSVYLENGLRVVIHKTEKSGIASCGVWVNQGSKHEDDSCAGISHYLEHLLVDKYNRNNPKLSKAFEDITNNGIFYNAMTTKEDTSFFFKGLSTHIAMMLRSLYTIVVKNDSYSDESICREKKVVDRETATYYSSFNQIKERTSQSLYGNKGVGRIIIGNTECINSVDSEQLQQIINSSYTPDNSTIVIVGDVEYREVLDIVQDVFSQWEDKETREYSEVVDAYPGIYFNTTNKTDNAILSIGFRLPQLELVQKSQIDIGATILGDPVMSSRIPYQIRHKNGLAYDVGYFVSTYEHRGTLAITTACKSSSIEEVVKIILDEITQFKYEGPSKEEMERAQKAIKTKRLIAISDISNQLSFLGKYASKGKMYSLENEIRTINKVRSDGVSKIMREVLIKENLGIAVIGKCDPDRVVDIISKYK